VSDSTWEGARPRDHGVACLHVSSWPKQDRSPVSSFGLRGAPLFCHSPIAIIPVPSSHRPFLPLPLSLPVSHLCVLLSPRPDTDRASLSLSLSTLHLHTISVCIHTYAQSLSGLWTPRLASPAHTARTDRFPGTGLRKPPTREPPSNDLGISPASSKTSSAGHPPAACQVLTRQNVVVVVVFLTFPAPNCISISSIFRRHTHPALYRTTRLVVGDFGEATTLSFFAAVRHTTRLR